MSDHPGFHSLREDTKNTHVPEMDVDTFLSSLMDTYEAAQDGYYDDADSSLTETMEEIQAALSTVEERTGRVERTLEDMGAHR